MRALGVIVEYNPFHNGHLFHLETAKRDLNPDVTIAVMSGNFLQRGEPALVNKWYRTKMALLGGVDIVLELPYRFATQKAETFALGAVSILNSIHCETVCFGSEDGEIDAFQKTRLIIEENQIKYQKAIKETISQGVSYPTALKVAFQRLETAENTVDLTKPNNILGYHYIEAIDKIGSKMKAFTIKRKNAEYHDEHFTSETIASATSIRKALLSNIHQSDIGQFIPASTRELLQQYYFTYKNFHQWENYWPLLKYRIVQATTSELKEIYEIEEGLENRLKKAAIHAKSFLDFMHAIKTKRYTWTRLQRACLHILTNTKKQAINEQKEFPTYLRLLGMTVKGQTYLNHKKKSFNVPLITRVSSEKDHFDLALDIKASQLYAFGLNEPYQSELLDIEYKHAPIILNS
ncbi:nucleotidyltransferase [Pseudoneobacillus sp. C159]